MLANAAGLWSRALTTTPVSDLFRTLTDLPGHWLQLQGAGNAGNSYFYTTTNFGQGFSVRPRSDSAPRRIH